MSAVDALMAIRRGFMASGISRTNSILSKPFEVGAPRLDIVRQAELPFEPPGRNTSVQELALGLLGLAALNGDDVLLGRLIGRATGDCQRNLVLSSDSRSML